MPEATIQSIYRYPVKGLSPQALARTALTAGGTLPHDRLYAPLSLGAHSGLAWNQAIGGAVFWIVGDLTSIPLLGALWRGLRREEHVRGEVRDEDLEVVAVEYAPGDGSAQARFRPWWEPDPELAGRFGADD